MSNLKPFVDVVDEEEILRVRRSLTCANIPYNQKFPAILLKKCKLSDKLFKTYHLKFFHVGAQTINNVDRLKFRPLNGRNSARRAVQSCILYFKNKPLINSQIMADFPLERLSDTHAFNCTGLDLCGLYINQRKGTLNKIYICIFVCFATKTIQIE